MSFGSPDRGTIAAAPLAGGGAFRSNGVYAALHMPDDAAVSPQQGYRYATQGRPSPLDMQQAMQTGAGGGAGSGAGMSPDRMQHQVSQFSQRPAAGTPQRSPTDASPAGRGGVGTTTTAAIGAAAAGSLLELLHAAETADTDRSGLLYGSQLLTCCRLQGIDEPSSILRQMVAECQAPDGRVEYVKVRALKPPAVLPGAQRTNMARCDCLTRPFRILSVPTVCAAACGSTRRAQCSQCCAFRG